MAVNHLFPGLATGAYPDKLASVRTEFIGTPLHPFRELQGSVSRVRVPLLGLTDLLFQQGKLL